MGERPDVDGLDPTLDVGDAPTLASDSGGGTTSAGLGVAPLAPGGRLGRYRLGNRLGAGAMGVVWAARDPNLDRPVAIKVVHPEFARAPDAAARLLREARAMAKVSHRGVVAVYDAGQAGDQLFLAMELVQGTTLGRLMRERTPADLADWRRWLGRMIDAGRGLAAAHAVGIVHRDFKPDNVLVSADGRVCVGDFGVAELSMAARGPDLAPSASIDKMTVADLTMTGALLGTPAYMSPEQLRGQAADARADQFSFCASLFEAIYGLRPFALPAQAGPTAVTSLIDTIEAGRIEPVPRERRVPRAIHDAIVRGLAPAPAARWPDMPALLAALVPPRRRAWLPIAVAVCGAGAVVVAVIALTRGGPAPVAVAPAAVAQPVTARTLFAVPMRPGVALSPDGTRVAIASADRIVVRAFAGGMWQYDHLDGAAVGRVEFIDRDHLRIGLATTRVVVDWDLTTDARTAPVAMPDGWTWQGSVAGGALLSRVVGRDFELAVAIGADPPRVIGHGPGRIEVIAIAPARDRVAYVEPSPTAGRLVVVEVATGAAVRSAPIVELSGLAWRDAERMWVTTGTTTRPVIHEAAVTATAIGALAARYTEDRGWFGPIASAAGRTVFVDNANSFRAKLVTADGIVQDLDPELVGAGFGWLDDGRWLAWSRTTGALVPDDDKPSERIRADIDGEPGNATRADDVAIVAMRKPGGREVVAVSLRAARRLWSAPVGALGFVRCAGDRRPPCVASAQRDGEPARIVRIDPRSGALGDELARAVELQDAALAPDGHELLLCDGSPVVRVLDLAHGTERTVVTPLSNTRSVAYDERGGFLVAGTKAPISYQILRIDGAQVTTLIQSDNEILFMPRAAPDRRATLVMGRLFMPVLHELIAP
jgi:hypothetical protein